MGECSTSPKIESTYMEKLDPTRKWYEKKLKNIIEGDYPSPQQSYFSQNYLP